MVICIVVGAVAIFLAFSHQYAVSVGITVIAAIFIPIPYLVTKRYGLKYYQMLLSGSSEIWILLKIMIFAGIILVTCRLNILIIPHLVGSALEIPYYVFSILLIPITAIALFIMIAAAPALYSIIIVSLLMTSSGYWS